MDRVYNTRYLRVLLKCLPSSLPCPSASQSAYGFHEFGISDEEVNDYGSAVGAVNRQLEVRLGPRTGRGNTFELKERGPGIEALADVLDRYLEAHPGDILLQKWTEDACRAAEIVYKDANSELPTSTMELNLSDSGSDTEFVVSVGAGGWGSDGDSVVKSKANMQKKKKSAKKRPDTKLMTEFDDDRFSDTDEEEDTRAGGAKVEPLLPKVTRPCYNRSPNGGGREGGKRVRCIASRQCHKSWAWPRHQQRVLGHTVNCAGVPRPDRDRARELMAAKASQSESSTAAPSRRKRRRRRSHSDSDNSDADESSDSAGNKGPKRTRTAQAVSVKQDDSSRGGTFEAFAKQGLQHLKETGDHALLMLLVGAGIPPSVADTEWFKHFIATIQPKYHPPSSTTLRDRLIPNEAAKLHLKLVEELKETRNLTLSFDGGKLRRPRGIYTATITTPVDRKSFILDLNDASYVSHTAAYISSEILEPVLEKVHSKNVAGVVSDNTGNTRKARKLIAAKYPHILNLQDCCHEINLALLQINELEEFQGMISDVKQILTFMHHSTYAMEHYDAARKDLKIKRGLSRIGATRFWTYVTAVESVYHGLPAFRKIVGNAELSIDIAGKNELFDELSVATRLFEIQLVQYLAVTTPFSRAIKCLESASTTAADVYAFWLGIMSSLESLMTDGSSRAKLSKRTMEDVRAIANQRFNELIEEGQEYIYVSGYVLHPGYRDAQVLRTGNVNPLAIPSVRIQRGASGTPVAISSASDHSGRNKLIARVGIWLRGLLLREYGGNDMVDRSDIKEIMKTRNPLLAGIHPADAYDRLKSELEAYAKKKEPFDRKLRPNQTVLQWWTKVQKDEGARVLGALAIKIFSIVPHSIADERFMSFITWMNEARRSCQQVQTVQDHLTIRQHYLNGRDPNFCPQVQRSRKPERQVQAVTRWCDLEPGGRETHDAQALPEVEADDEVDDPEQQDRAHQRAREALCMGANVGSLEQERRTEFVVADCFDLRSRFLRELLADPGADVAPSNEQGSAKDPTVSGSLATSATGPAVRPSKLDWTKWA